MPIRNKAFRIFTIPIAAFLWVIGWSLYWVLSTRKEAPKKKAVQQKQNNLTFVVATPEQWQHATTN